MFIPVHYSLQVISEVSDYSLSTKELSQIFHYLKQHNKIDKKEIDQKRGVKTPGWTVEEYIEIFNKYLSVRKRRKGNKKTRDALRKLIDKLSTTKLRGHNLKSNKYTNLSYFYYRSIHTVNIFLQIAEDGKWEGDACKLKDHISHMQSKYSDRKDMPFIDINKCYLSNLKGEYRKRKNEHYDIALSVVKAYDPKWAMKYQKETDKLILEEKI